MSRMTVWKVFISVIVCIVASTTLVIPSCPTPTIKIVFAHYMHSYILGDYVTNDHSLPSNPDTLTAWPPSEFYERSWWPNSLNSIAQAGVTSETVDLNLGAAAGVDAFSLLVSPTNIQSPAISAYQQGMTNLAQAAASTTTKLIPDLWFSSDSGQACTPTNPCDAASWAAYGNNVKQYLLDPYPNSFLTINGKWVIIVASALYANNISASAFAHFFDPWGGPTNFIVIESSGTFTDQTTFAASGWATAAQYLSMWTANVGWGAVQYGNLLTEANNNSNILAWPVHSAYFALRPGNQSIQENFGITNLVDQWKYAITNNVNFTNLQSWNDFSEDHAITQTNTKGKTLIHITRYFSDWFKTQGQPIITKDRIFLFYQRQLTGATLTSSTAVATVPGCSQSAVVDYLSVVSMLVLPGVLELTDGALDMTLNVPAGFHEWLVYVPSTRGCTNVYPTASSTRDVNNVSSIPAGLPAVTLKRSSILITSVTGPVSIANTAPYQDLSMVGAESADPNSSVPY